MFSLNFTPKDLEVKNSDIINTKFKAQNSNKDFLEVLEGKKSNIKIKDQIKELNTANKNKKNYLIQEKTIVEDKELTNLEESEKLDEIEIQLITILQSLYNLLEDLDMESNILNESIFHTLGFKIQETVNLLEHLMDDNLLISNEKYLLEFEDKTEDFIKSMEIEMEKFKAMDIDREIKIPLEENLNQLEETLNNLKVFSEKNSIISLESSIDNEEHLKEDVNNVESTPVEIKDITEKNSSNNEEEVELDLQMEKDIETKDIENPVPNFEIESKNIIKDINLLKTEKPENIDIKKVIDQMVDKAKLVLDDFKQEIKISLKPEILGELILKMEVEKGNLLTKIMVDNYRTKELIEANLYELKQEMKENGLEIKTFEVFVGTNEDFQREKGKEFHLGKKSKKIKVKDKKIKEIKLYDENVFQRSEDVYGEGQLNLFA